MSVLGAAVLELLAPRDGGVYVDGTLGGAGHASAILEASGPSGRLIGIDRDPDALAAAGTRLAGYGDRVTTIHGTFGDMAELLADRGIGPVDGILLDVGVSSHQLDRAERGFSFSHDGPLDMRMDPTGGPTCLDLLRSTPVGELSAILRDFGEERYHNKIARRIKERVADGELTTTGQLAELVRGCLPARDQRYRIHPATRTFQALRIAVNGELEQLERFLADFPDLLAPGGRCAVISFHSLEDRLVKRRFRDLAHVSNLPPHLARAAGEPVEPVCTVLTKKPRTATDEEIAENPRARSAKLRACERFASQENSA